VGCGLQVIFAKFSFVDLYGLAFAYLCGCIWKVHVKGADNDTEFEFSGSKVRAYEEIITVIDSGTSALGW
jgi:hypothetical protein